MHKMISLPLCLASSPPHSSPDLSYVDQYQPSMDQVIHRLQTCRRSKELAQAKILHSQLCSHGMEFHAELGSHLVQLFVDCQCMEDAHRAFRRLSYHNEFSWTSLILGYTQHGDHSSTFNPFQLYQKMLQHNVVPSKFTFMALLKYCVKVKCVEKGREVEREISEHGFENDLIVRNCVVDMYVKCGLLTEARDAVRKMLVQDVVTWNTIIGGYVDHDLNEEALAYYQEMKDAGVAFNDLTYVSLLKACKNLRNLERGQELHSEIAKEGFENDVFVSSSLLDMYSKCGNLNDARDVFEELPVKDVVVWTTLLTGYMDHGLNAEALNCIEMMETADVSPNIFTYLCALKACCSLKDVNKGQRLYSDVVKKGLDGEALIGNILVDMYSKCGKLGDARGVFDLLQVRDVVSWNALLTGYAEHGLAEQVLDGFQKMQEDGISLTSATLVSSLRACTILEEIDRGRTVHVEIAQEGYEEDAFVCSALVGMYAKCGSLEEARDTFDSLRVHDVVTWTTLIVAYTEHGRGEEALQCTEKMKLEGFLPDAVTLVCTLKACISIGAFNTGRDLHLYALKVGLERNAFVANCLIEMYAHYGSYAEAKYLFDKMPCRDVVSWNSLISGYAEQGFHEEVLDCFEQMQSENVPANAGTHITFLKSCGSAGALEHGQKIHADIVQNQLEEDLFVGNNLVDMYGKFQLLDEALEVFEELLVRDVFSWNALIGCHVDNGVLEEALLLYEQMQLEGVAPSHVTFTSCLKACGLLGNIEKGYELHDETIRRGFEIDTYTGNSLIDMYAKCGSLTEAESIFEELPARDPVSWTILIANYAELGLEETALEVLESMETEGVSPDTFAYVCGLKACTSIGDKEKSRELHSRVVKRGLDSELVIGNALLDTYSKHRLLSDVASVFETLPWRDVISWTGLISAYAEQAHHHGEAVRCFERMQAEKASPDAVTLMYLLKACGIAGDDEKGREFHGDVLARGFDAEAFIGNVLVDMYARCGCVAEAKAVFDGLAERDAFSWNALCAAYAAVGMADEASAWFEAMQREGVAADAVSWSAAMTLCIEGGEDHRALRCYLQMQEQGSAPDSMGYTSILKACGNASALEAGRRVHAQLSGGIGDVVLATSFVDMYSRCGSMREAREVFEAMPAKDAVAWNALLTGQARHGETRQALELFERMMREGGGGEEGEGEGEDEGEDGVKPDAVAFVSVLAVCCHAGLVDEARECFRLMIHGYRITPSIEHANCLVDLLGRAGQLGEAVRMLERMPFQPDSVAWSTVLAACRKWGDSELGKQAFDAAVSLDDEHSAAFVLMSDLSSAEPRS